MKKEGGGKGSCDNPPAPTLSLPAALQQADAQEVAEQPGGPGRHRGHAGRAGPDPAQDAG